MRRPFGNDVWCHVDKIACVTHENNDVARAALFIMPCFVSLKCKNKSIYQQQKKSQNKQQKQATILCHGMWLWCNRSELKILKFATELNGCRFRFSLILDFSNKQTKKYHKHQMKIKRWDWYYSISTCFLKIMLKSRKLVIRIDEAN